jgi:hypothetical protein
VISCWPAGHFRASSTTGQPFALPGDSGSAVVADDGTCIGIVFAVSGHAYSEKNPATTYVIPIQTILDAFNVKLL